MKKQFVTYEIAKKLEEIGFNYNVIATYDNEEKLTLFDYEIRASNQLIAPLWQQAIDWLREEHDIKVCECPSGGWKVWEKSDKKWLSFTFEFELSKAIEEAIKLIPNS